MPSYRTIIGELLRLAGERPGGPAVNAYRAMLKLAPRAEMVADPGATELQVEEHSQAWATAVAFDALRGWSWPYWINMQTNPASPAYGPVRPSFLRNHTVRDALPLLLPETRRIGGTLDRRGMFTPVDQRFSVEVWFRAGDSMFRPAEVLQDDSVEFEGGGGPGVVRLRLGNLEATVTATALTAEDFDYVKLDAALTVGPDHDPMPLAIYFAIRPVSLEGVVPVFDLVYNSKGFWMSESRVAALFTRKPELSWASNARQGDAGLFISAPPDRTAVRCAAGMATAISGFHSEDGCGEIHADILVPLRPVFPRELPFAALVPRTGQKRKSTVRARNTREEARHTSQGGLIDGSLAQLMACTDTRVSAVQRMFVRKNNWVVVAVRALAGEGATAAAERLLNYCLLGVQPNGYLPGAHGRWAFQGQVLTAIADLGRLGDRSEALQAVPYARIQSIAKWIMRKRREVSHAPKKPAGLLPPGLSPTGMGPEYNFVDNLWAIEGLLSATWLARQHGHHGDADVFYEDAVKLASRLMDAIHRELEYSLQQLVPGRFQRPFDAASGSEILDLMLTTEAAGMIRQGEWLDQLIKAVSLPLNQGLPAAEGLLQMDLRGVVPARRLLLFWAQIESNGAEQQDLDSLANDLTTGQLVWPDVINRGCKSGAGEMLFDPEAAALYLILRRKLADEGQ